MYSLRGHISGWGNFSDLVYARSVDHAASIVVYDFTRYKPFHVDIKGIYSAIESIKNGCFFSPKYKSTSTITACPHILAFSNRFPDINALSRDRWVIYFITPNYNPSSKLQPLCGISSPLHLRYLIYSFKLFYIHL